MTISQDVFYHIVFFLDSRESAYQPGNLTTKIIAYFFATRLPVGVIAAITTEAHRFFLM